MSRTDLYLAANFAISYLEIATPSPYYQGSRRLCLDPPYTPTCDAAIKQAKLELEIWAGRAGNNVRR